MKLTKATLKYMGKATAKNANIRQFDDGQAIWLTISDSDLYNAIADSKYAYGFKLGYLTTDAYLKYLDADLADQGLITAGELVDICSGAKVVFFYK